MAQIIADRVKETSTTTGTGAFTLAGAMTGFIAFSSVCANGDTAYYAIQSVDSSGNPTSDWETGLGTWGTGGILTRTIVLASSNSNTAVSFSSGTKHVWIDAPAKFLKSLIVGVTDVSASGYGETLTLPDATTLTVGADFSYKNNSPYDKRVKDNSGTVLGFIPAWATVQAVCQNISSAAGIWQISQISKMGMVAERTMVDSFGSTALNVSTVILDSDRQFIACWGSSCYGIIYNKTTNTWGNEVLLRSSLDGAIFIKSATDQILMLDGLNTSTTLNMTVLSISGTTITVNTSVPKTLAGNFTSFGDLIAVGTSWVVSFLRATTAAGHIAITISGTTPSAGSESSLSGTAIAAHLYANTSSTYTCVSSTSGNLYAKTNSLSGTTITTGTENNIVISNSTFRTMMMSSGRIAIMTINSTSVGGFISVSGTVPTISTAALSSGNFTVGSNDWIAVSSSKVLCMMGGSTGVVYFNNLIDSSGTASAGTAINLTGTSISGNFNYILDISGNTVRATTQYVSGTTNNVIVCKIDASGTSPTATYKSQLMANGSGSAPPLNPYSTSALRGGAIHPSIVPSGSGTIIPSGIERPYSFYFTDTVSIIPNATWIGINGLQIGSHSRNEGWVFSGTTGYRMLSKIEVAP